ncbi:multidrug resistance-like protein [Aureobasidium pullulans]|uniref:Multidrug resistance-like protein n=1 Tax=Aureobasidium pullulans TaxID=5580 RepID=A0A4S8XHV9_AURPU|nr:multidrug resistance-like protein [Aureobasidium pullulans]THY08960.1 multidrug resistance-like protein [Aureobasidium pullulans]
MLLNAYLFITTIFDAATLRTLWLLTPFSPRIRNIFTVAFVIKAVVLLLEARGKRNYVKTEQNKSPEDFSGLYGQALLSWLNGLVWKGARHLLKPEDLYDISEDVASERLSKRFAEEWERQSKTGPADLKKVIFQLLKWPILVPIVPRLALLALTLCQPLLLKRLLDYLNNSDTESVNIGYGIIGAYLIVYVGLATTSAIYWHRHYRFLSMLRGTLITAVYGKAINLSTVEKDNKASLTLMSTDVERTIRGLIDLHEMWANIFQVAVVTWLIEIELGAACVGPVIIALGLLGETPLSKGRVELSSSNIAYCEQTAWLMNASIQRNIINFSEFDSEFYSSVIHACDLDSDLEVLQKGDATVVGSKGFALSGGQKQRIALARAVYARCSIIILDDVFSQLDLSTQSIIFERLLGPQGLLRRWKTTVVITVGASKFFSRADHVVVLSSEGTILDQGTFQELCTRDNKAASYIVSAEESAPEQSFTESAYNEDSTKARKVYAKHGDSKTDDKDLDAARQRGDFSIYRYYLACISWTVAAIFLLLQLTYAFLSTFPTIWLKWWADANMQDSGSRYGYHIGVYTMLQVGALALSSAVTWWTFNVMAVKTGIQLHNALAKTVMSAPLAFWSKVDTGSVLTRFSQDVQFLDIQLPPALMIVTTTLLVCIAQVGLIATASAWIAISFPALFAVFYSVQKFYLRTSRQLRYLDLEEKAPVYTQFLETLDGLATIRAFNWSQPSIKHNFEIVDRSQKPNYLTWALKKWLALVLDLVITGIAVLVVGVVVGLRDSSSTGFTGVSLTQIISFTTNVKFLIMFWTQLESSLGAVARIRQFEKDTIAEDQPEETHDPSFDWPSRGSININSLSAKYSPDSERLTLDNITMSIPAGSKVGFCGRTGSGKSSLLLTLFKLLTPGSGNITIDGLDLSIIRRETLRSRLICIAEEPFMFPSSVRDNLALDSTAITDEQMVSVLRQAGLWEAVEVKGGLDAEMKEVHLSQGSKQLFNIARALLRKDQGRVLIMDEATSSIDTQTDINIQALIRKEFSSHTIISVAHKLETIVDFDFVGVLDEGKLVEYDNPKTLLKQEGSRFKDLWDER